MYIDNAPLWFYALTSICALFVAILVVLKILDYVYEVLPRRKRTRRFLESLHEPQTHYASVNDALDDEVQRYHGKNVLFFESAGVVRFTDGAEHEFIMCQCERCQRSFVMRYIDEKHYCPGCGSRFTGMLPQSVKDWEKKQQHE